MYSIYASNSVAVVPCVCVCCVAYILGQTILGLTSAKSNCVEIGKTQWFVSHTYTSLGISLVDEPVPWSSHRRTTSHCLIGNGQLPFSPVYLYWLPSLVSLNLIIAQAVNSPRLAHLQRTRPLTLLFCLLSVRNVFALLLFVSNIAILQCTLSWLDHHFCLFSIFTIQPTTTLFGETHSSIWLHYVAIWVGTCANMLDTHTLTIITDISLNRYRHYNESIQAFVALVTSG